MVSELYLWICIPKSGYFLLFLVSGLFWISPRYIGLSVSWLFAISPRYRGLSVSWFFWFGSRLSAEVCILIVLWFFVYHYKDVKQFWSVWCPIYWEELFCLGILVSSICHRKRIVGSCGWEWSSPYWCYKTVFMEGQGCSGNVLDTRVTWPPHYF